MYLGIGECLLVSVLDCLLIFFRQFAVPALWQSIDDRLLHARSDGRVHVLRLADIVLCYLLGACRSRWRRDILVHGVRCAGFDTHLLWAGGLHLWRNAILIHGVLLASPFAIEITDDAADDEATRGKTAGEYRGPYRRRAGDNKRDASTVGN